VRKLPVHPIAFLILYLPYGIASGYVSVTLVYLLSHAGASVTEVAALVAVSLLPQTWKVLWAPIIDTTLTAKRWYLISALSTGLILLGMAFVPTAQRMLHLFDALALIISIACSVSAMSTESLMARVTAPDQMGRAGGWSQSGNLGGAGLGGGAGLWMAQHVAPWTAGAALGVACLLCCTTLWFVEEHSRPLTAERYSQRIVDVGRSVWAIARSRRGFLTLLLFVLPIGSGAAVGLWPAIASDWRANGDTVALVNGVLGGLVSIGGCLVGGYLCDHVDRKSGYAVAGILLALCAAAMALAPKTRDMFIVFTCAYGFITGMVFAAFTGVALETIGTDSPATKYNVLACISNLPITAMTMIDGWSQTGWGSAGMLNLEAIIGIMAVTVFAAVAAVTRRPAAALA
jgi:PAT family beta-lactamase induction signal transducer AmpG